MKPLLPSNLKIRYKKAWYEIHLSPLTAMLKHSGISQKIGCRRDTWVSYTLDNQQLSRQGLIVLAGERVTSHIKLNY